MGEENFQIHEGMRTPRAAAVAGILFCVLLITSQLLVWISIPASLGRPGLDVISHSKTISLALNLPPFAGIAFLWFIAVVRNRLGIRRPLFCHRLLGKRIAIHRHDLHISCPCRWTHPGLKQCTRTPGTDGHVRVGSCSNLPNDERVRNQDGGRIHVLDFNDLVAIRDCSTLDCIPRLRSGGDTPVKYWCHLVDSACVSTLGISDQCCHTA